MRKTGDRGPGTGNRASTACPAQGGRGVRDSAGWPTRAESLWGAHSARAKPARSAGPTSAWLCLALLVAASVALAAVPGAPAATPEERFREATQHVQAGNVQKGIAVYRELAAGGYESGSLYWNWAQAASSKGALGEALWALLRGSELEGSDAAGSREVERLRQAANLDSAELAPDPLATLASTARHLHLDILALALLAASLAAHGIARVAPAARWPVLAAWLALASGLALAAVVLVGTLARPTAVVVRRGVPLADAASPTATVLATLREGEVVPVLGASGTYLRVQDSSGARGWVTAQDVWRLDRPPAATLPGR